MVAYIRGPMVFIAIAVFIIGSIFQIFRYFQLSRRAFGKVPSSFLPRPRKDDNVLSLIQRIFNIFCQLKETIYAIHPTTMAVSTLFHVSLIITPLFLLDHNEIIFISYGICLPSLPEWISDGMTLVVLCCGAYFLIRRMALARMRAISTWVDYLVLALAITPFLSGFLACHQIFDYRTMIIIHMVSGELMLMAIPFTKLAHMTFFFFSRFLINNEHTLGRGKRVWQ